jgi:hypothetical protein
MLLDILSVVKWDRENCHKVKSDDSIVKDLLNSSMIEVINLFRVYFPSGGANGICHWV